MAVHDCHLFNWHITSVPRYSLCLIWTNAVHEQNAFYWPMTCTNFCMLFSLLLCAISTLPIAVCATTFCRCFNKRIWWWWWAMTLHKMQIIKAQLSVLGSSRRAVCNWQGKYWVDCLTMMSITYISPLISKSHVYALCGLCWCLLVVIFHYTWKRASRERVSHHCDWRRLFLFKLFWRCFWTGLYIHVSPEFNDRQTWILLGFLIFAIRR